MIGWHKPCGLLKALPEDAKPTGGLIQDAIELDRFYIPTRYPNGFDRGSPKDYFTAAETILRDKCRVVEVSLFGSLAAGRGVPGSDADILIVLDKDERRILDRIPEFAHAFLEAPICVDILPYTGEEIARMLAIGGPATQ